MSLPIEWRHRLKLPLLIAPMFLVSTVDLVLAACRSGAIGSFPTGNARTLQDLDDWLKRISTGLSHTDAPWAVNLVVHRTYDRLDEDLALVEKYRPPLVITALGSPHSVVERIHGFGGRVFADVSSIKHARQAVAAGVDGLVLVASGAGGHTGQMTAFAMLPQIREFFDGTVVLGGGLSNGAGIRAAEILGADLASMGTRFIACNETMASDAYRQMLVESTIDDLILTKAITGVSAYWLKKSLIAAGLDLEALQNDIPIDFTTPGSKVPRWTQVWSAGHGVGSIKSIEPAADLLRTLHSEYWAAVRSGSSLSHTSVLEAVKS